MNQPFTSAPVLAADGFAVFPLQPGLKEPYAGTRGFLDATTDPEQIRRWLSVPGAERSNIAIRPAPGVLVVDVDKRHGGLEALSKLAADGKDLPDTLTVKTGDGGLHAYYVVSANLAWPKEIVHGIDLKGENGYLVAPPSVHPNGNRYEWIDVRPMAAAPAWLVALGRPKGERAAVIVEDEGDAPALPDETIAAVVAQLEPVFAAGKKHALAFAIGGWLKQRNWNQTDIVRVIEALPSKSPRARVKDALDGYRATNDHGWHTIRDLIGEAPAAALDAVTPNPRRAVALQEREAAAGLVAAMAASAPAAPVVTLPGQMPAWYVPVDLREVPPPLDFIVPDLELATGGRPNMIVGYSNAGKSIAAQALAFAIAMGLPAWGQFPTRRRRVLYLDAENILVTRENFARLAYAYDVPLGEMAAWLVVVDSALYLDGAAAEAELATVIQRENFGAVFVDTYRASTQVAKENDMEFARPLYMLKRVSVGLRTMFTVVHHEKKPTDGDKRAAVEHMISGHNAIHGAIQVGISLIHDDANQVIAVRPSKKIRKGFEPFHLKITDVGAGSIGEAVAAGMSSPGVRVEYVGANAVPKPVNEDTMSAALTRILIWLRSNAANGQQVRCDTVLRTRELGGAGGKKATNLAAMERLERDGQVHVSGSPRMVALVLDAPPYDPRSIAPPESADRPPMSQSIVDFRAALPRREEDNDEE